MNSFLFIVGLVFTVINAVNLMRSPTPLLALMSFVGLACGIYTISYYGAQLGYWA